MLHLFHTYTREQCASEMEDIVIKTLYGDTNIDLIASSLRYNIAGGDSVGEGGVEVLQ